MTTGKRKAPDDEELSQAGTSSSDATGQAIRFSKSIERQQRRGRAWSTQSNDDYYRDLYAVEPDFRRLAHQDPDFAAMYVCLLILSQGPLLTFVQCQVERTAGLQ